VTPPSRRRILITTDTVGGVWTYVTTLARELAQRRCDVVLVTLGPPPRPEQIAALAFSPNISVEITDFALEWMDPEGRDFARAKRGLSHIAWQVKPDLVHLNGFREALCNWPAPVVLVAHSCVRSWWRACRRTDPDEPRWNDYVARVKEALAACDRWVAPTAAFRDEMLKLYVPPSRGHVIHNGLAGASIRQLKEPFIVAAGRLWDEAKNVQAISSITGELPWPVKLVGPLPSTLGSTSPPIEFLGELPRAQVLECMARAGIYVAPARYEPFGLCALEAALARCALVLSDIPTFTELWSGAALFVEPENRRELVASLQHLCAEDRMRSRLQAGAAERAARYSADAMARAYCELYDELIGAKTSRRPAQFASTGKYA
jgi:glycosyltransferase involved in cell wall biosynthesis